MRKISVKEAKIGLSVIVALAILFFGINFLKGINLFHAAHYYYAKYNNVTGLSVSAPVTLNGYKIGQVREIEYDYEHPGNVIVELALDRGLAIPVGTKAVLSSDILGTATIELELGNNTSLHQIGDSLQGVTKPGLVDALGSEVMPNIGQIFTKVDTLLTNVNSLLANPALQTSITRIDAITSNLQTTTEQLAQITKALAPIPGQIAPILADVKGATGNIDNITSDLTGLSARMRDLPVDSLLNTLQATTENLRQLSEQLNDPNSSLGLLMNNPALYNNINHTVMSLDSLFVDIKKNPKRYVTVKVF